ncbi:hypothetical protein HI914_03452 [Erysiphe necator]|nr:hypothetical protein HI914_03452 [Erysiphe necator]
MAQEQHKSAMTPKDASRIQSATAKAGADTGSGSFPARAQSAAANNVNTGRCQDNCGQNAQGKK